MGILILNTRLNCPHAHLFAQVLYDARPSEVIYSDSLEVSRASVIYSKTTESSRNSADLSLSKLDLGSETVTSHLDVNIDKEVELNASASDLASSRLNISAASRELEIVGSQPASVKPRASQQMVDVMSSRTDTNLETVDGKTVTKEVVTVSSKSGVRSERRSKAVKESETVTTKEARVSSEESKRDSATSMEVREQTMTIGDEDANIEVESEVNSPVEKTASNLMFASEEEKAAMASATSLAFSSKVVSSGKCTIIFNPKYHLLEVSHILWVFFIKLVNKSIPVIWITFIKHLKDMHSGAIYTQI